MTGFWETTGINMTACLDTRLKQRAVIEFLTAEGVPPIDIHRRMEQVYGAACVDVSTVRRWARKSKDADSGTSTLNDEPHTGRPVSVTDDHHKQRVDELIRKN